MLYRTHKTRVHFSSKYF